MAPIEPISKGVSGAQQAKISDVLAHLLFLGDDNCDGVSMSKHAYGRPSFFVNNVSNKTTMTKIQTNTNAALMNRPALSR